MPAKYQAYPEYKASGLGYYGDIPNHWNLERIKFNSYVKGRQGWQNLRADEYQESGPYLVTGSHFDKKGSVDWSQCHHISEARYLRDSDIWIKEHDVLITKDGTIGKVAYIQMLPDKSCLNSHLLIIRSLFNKYDQRFLFHLLNSPCFKGFIPTRQTGTTFFGITQEAIEEFPLILPSIEEQKQIAKFLDHETAKIDTLIEKQQQLIKLLKEKRQAVISHAVTKGLNPNAPIKDSGVEWLGDVPAHWESIPLKLVIHTRKGVAFKSTDFCDKGIRVVKASDIKQKTIRATDVFLPESFVSENPKAQLNTGDIILSTVGSNPDVKNSAVGQIGMVPKELSGTLLNQNTVVFDPDETKIMREYLFYVLQMDAYRDHLDLNAHGTANQSSLSIADMLNFNISIPPVNEQLKICAGLSMQQEKLQRLELRSKESESLLKERRTALISAAVTGKIDVRYNVGKDS